MTEHTHETAQPEGPRDFDQTQSPREPQCMPSELIVLLSEAAGFARIVAVVLFTIVGFMVASVLFVLLGAALAHERGRPLDSWALGVSIGAWLVSAVLHLVPAMLLWRCARDTKSFDRTRERKWIESALRANKMFWKFAAIVMLTFACITGATVLILIVASLR